MIEESIKQFLSEGNLEEAKTITDKVLGLKEDPRSVLPAPVLLSKEQQEELNVLAKSGTDREIITFARNLVECLRGQVDVDVAFADADDGDIYIDLDSKNPMNLSLLLDYDGVTFYAAAFHFVPTTFNFSRFTRLRGQRFPPPEEVADAVSGAVCRAMCRAMAYSN